MLKNFLYVFVSVLLSSQFVEASDGFQPHVRRKDSEMTFSQILAAAHKKQSQRNVPVIPVKRADLCQNHVHFSGQKTSFVARYPKSGEFNESPATVAVNSPALGKKESLLTKALEGKSNSFTPVGMSPITTQFVDCFEHGKYEEAVNFISKSFDNRSLTPEVAKQVGDCLIVANRDIISSGKLSPQSIDAVSKIAKEVNLALSKRAEFIRRLEDRYNQHLLENKMPIAELSKLKKENDARIKKLRDLK